MQSDRTDTPDLGYIPLERVALSLGLHHSTLRRWIRDGQLPAYRIGRRVYIKQEDLDALAERWTPARAEDDDSPTGTDKADGHGGD